MLETFLLSLQNKVSHSTKLKKNYRTYIERFLGTKTVFRYTTNSRMRVTIDIQYRELWPLYLQHPFYDTILYVKQ